MYFKYLNKFIDLGRETGMRHHKFNNDEIDWYILLSRSRIRFWSVLRGRIQIRSKTRRIRNTAWQGMAAGGIGVVREGIV
jgi:hypothetical protein